MHKQRWRLALLWDNRFYVHHIIFSVRAAAPQVSFSQPGFAQNLLTLEAAGQMLLPLLFNYVPTSASSTVQCSAFFPPSYFLFLYVPLFLFKARERKGGAVETSRQAERPTIFLRRLLQLALWMDWPCRQLSVFVPDSSKWLSFIQTYNWLPTSAASLIVQWRFCTTSIHWTKARSWLQWTFENGRILWCFFT